MLTKEKINSNFLLFQKKLETYGCFSEEMMNDLGEKIKNAPYSLSYEYGGCYDGALVDVTLRVLCNIAYQINEFAFGKAGNADGNYKHPFLAVNPNKLMKVLLLLNIAKAVMFVEEKEDWKIKRGQLYKFEDFETTLKLGARTLFLCQKYGIVLEEDEYEAILSIDDAEDNGARFRTPLYTLVKAAKLFAMVEIRQDWLSRNKKPNTAIEEI
jgi:hypothetical protein